jgi:hypothetical protein
MVTQPGSGGTTTRPPAAPTTRASHTPEPNNRTARAPTDARPRLRASPHLPPLPRPSHHPTLVVASSSPNGSPEPDQSIRLLLPGIPIAAAPPPALKHPPGLTRPGFTWTVEEGGPARSGGPLPPKPRREAKTGRGRGGALLRSRTKPIERNRSRETHGGKQGHRQRRVIAPSFLQPLSPSLPRGQNTLSVRTAAAVGKHAFRGAAGRGGAPRY